MEHKARRPPRGELEDGHGVVDGRDAPQSRSARRRIPSRGSGFPPCTAGSRRNLGLRDGPPGRPPGPRTRSPWRAPSRRGSGCTRARVPGGDGAVRVHEDALGLRAAAVNADFPGHRVRRAGG